MNDIFSKNLRQLRRDKQMTQEQVAEIIGVSAQSVSRWETGATFPDILLLPELSKLYGVLVDDLFKESPEGYENYASRLLAVYETTWKHEDFLAAAREFEKMVKTDTMSPEDYRKYGLLHDYMSSVCTGKAYEFYDKSMANSKDNDPDLFYRVKRQKNMLRIARGEGQVCIDEQKKAIQDAPDNAEEYTCLVAALFNAKQYEECYVTVKNAMARFPREAMLYIWAGDVCRELKKYEEAFYYWEKHQELDSKWLDSRYAMGFCYEEIGEFRKAYEVWTTLAKILTERGGVIEAEWSREMAEKCLKRA
ncbi:MAG: helix-turn-helix domain-containing protein [Lachnospiraceae bacterium]|nr:helix-turn-helix domain-containing protein [Lachnospiraceae bacterium]